MLSKYGQGSLPCPSVQGLECSLLPEPACILLHCSEALFLKCFIDELQRDARPARVAAFAKRLLQVCAFVHTMILIF